MLLIPSDFKGKMNIPNFGDVVPLSNKLGTDSFVYSILNDEVREELIGLLGWDMYLEISQNVSLELNERMKPTTPQIIIDLVDGVGEYSGLVKPLISFVYYHYLKSVNSNLGGGGVKTIDSKSGVRYSSREKAVQYYNKYVKYMYGSGGNNPILRSYFGGLSVDYQGIDNKNSNVYSWVLENKINYPSLSIGVRKCELINNIEI